MSTADTFAHASVSERSTTANTVSEFPDVVGAIRDVASWITPVWPLQDLIAVNPYAGFADQNFLTAQSLLSSVSGARLLMPLSFYGEQYRQGAFDKAHIDKAVDEMVADGIQGAEFIDSQQLVAWLQQDWVDNRTIASESPHGQRMLYTVSEELDLRRATAWTEFIVEEVSKYCSQHYDRGQASWRSSMPKNSLYQAFRKAGIHDLTSEVRGIADFRRLVGSLPEEPAAAVELLLDELEVPSELLRSYLHCLTFTAPGWMAWTRYQQRQAERDGRSNDDFVGLLALCLTHQVALARQFEHRYDWETIRGNYERSGSLKSQPTEDDLGSMALLRATEISYRESLISNLSRHNRSRATSTSENPSAKQVLHHPPGTRKLAQLVFCIDVRSERMRRHLEDTSKEIETFGFAGFFGLPISFQRLGETGRSDQVPMLAQPAIHVTEEIDSPDAAANGRALRGRAFKRGLRKSWKGFQSSAVSMFAFVETMGLVFAVKLLLRTFGFDVNAKSRFDGIHSQDRSRLSPSIRSLQLQGIDEESQVDMALSILQGIGIRDEFSRLVVFCGHAGHSENNPVKAGLDCGACGGHSGEANARIAAQLFNQPFVRAGLLQKGIAIPTETHFVAALHNTTTDEIEFLDQHLVPQSHLGDLNDLNTVAQSASRQNRKERLLDLPGPTPHDVIRRSRDWAEVRPEWGLAGNAAFIAAPRSLTSGLSLGGRAFLHSYDFEQDEDYGVLEQIMTAPMIVANWINLQYYASTVDPDNYGSGNKTIHNVVGQFGILSGNGGDLKTGLPWQSIHDGDRYRHQPLRLLVAIAAPRTAIDDVVRKHPQVRNLLDHGWIQLVAWERNNFYRYCQRGQWDELPATELNQLAS